MKTILSALLIILTSNTYAQKNCDTIKQEIDMGRIYIYEGKKLKPKQLLSIMEPNPAAYSEMKIAKTNYDVGSAFAFTGGFLMGWSLGSLIVSRHMDWRIAGVGAGLVGLSIPFSIGQTRHTRQAVKLFNDAAKSNTCSIRLRINYSINQLGVVANF